MWWYKLHPPHVINVVTLPCENRNSENVILQWVITKENCITCIVYASSKWTCRLQNLGCYAAMHVRNKDFWYLDLQKSWPKLGLTLNRTLSRLRLTSGATVWDHVCMLVADTLNTCCEIVVHLYYVVHQNILGNCRCNLVHLMTILWLMLKAEFMFTCSFFVSTLTR